MFDDRWPGTHSGNRLTAIGHQISTTNAHSPTVSDQTAFAGVGLWYQINTMKEMIPLWTIEYNVPSTAEPGTAGPMQYKYPAHLLNVQIDFQNGRLLMDGNWKFIMGSNNQAETHWFDAHRETVRLSATLFPGKAIDLADATTGVAFTVEGMLADGESEIEYEGLLLMDPAKENKTPETKCWNISLYLYNNELDGCEIKLKWPVYTAARFAELN